MKLLSSQQMYEADQATIVNLPISSTDLMEKAATECANWILERFPDFIGEFNVICGVGNNGGDGLVISRVLLDRGFKVNTYVVPFSKNQSTDFSINLKRLTDIGQDPVFLDTGSEDLDWAPDSIIVDAIFGLGLTRPPSGSVLEVIQSINRSGARVISIDFPSGLFADRSTLVKDSVVCADHCLTFQNPKLAFFLPDNEPYLKEWEVLDIGLDKKFIEGLESRYLMNDLMRVRQIFRKRNRFSHKGSFGHSMIIGGSFGKVGAVILASKGAICAGSGLVTSYIPKCGYVAMQAANPEVMVEVDDVNYLQFFNYKVKPNAIGIGPGLGVHLKTKKGFIKYLRQLNQPVVLDADALNILSEHDELLDLIPKNSILTPHPREFERLAGVWEDDYEKLNKLRGFAKKYHCVVVLKGAYTNISEGERIFFNNSGNPALATAGSGDVLTGMITGLLAQGYDSLEAAIIGVYLHGRAADLAIEDNLSMESFKAGDLVDYLGKSFKELY